MPDVLVNESPILCYSYITDSHLLHKVSLTFEAMKSCYNRNMFNSINQSDLNYDNLVLINSCCVSNISLLFKAPSVEMIESDVHLLYRFSPVTRLSVIINKLERLCNNRIKSYLDLRIFENGFFELLETFESFLNYEFDILYELLKKQPNNRTPFSDKRKNSQNDNVAKKFVEGYKQYFEDKITDFYKKLKNKIFEKLLNNNSYTSDFVENVLYKYKNCFLFNDKRSNNLNELINQDFAVFFKSSIDQFDSVTVGSILNAGYSFDFSELSFTTIFFDLFSAFINKYNYIATNQYYSSFQDSNSFYMRIMRNNKEFFKDLGEMESQFQFYYNFIFMIADKYSFCHFLNLKKFTFDLLTSLMKKIYSSFVNLTSSNSCSLNLSLYFALMRTLFAYDSDFVKSFYTFILKHISENEQLSFDTFYYRVFLGMPADFSTCRTLFIYGDFSWLQHIQNYKFFSHLSVDDKFQLFYHSDIVYLYIQSNYPFIKFICRYDGYNSLFINMFSDENNLFLVDSNGEYTRVPFVFLGLSPQSVALMISKFLGLIVNEQK